MIVRCSHCNKVLKIRDNLAGKRGRCPACQQVFTIPNQCPETTTQLKSKTSSSASQFIQTRCQNCNKLFKAPMSLAGKKVICSECKQAFIVINLDEKVPISQTDVLPQKSINSAKVTGTTHSTEQSKPESEQLPVFSEAPNFPSEGKENKQPILIPVSCNTTSKNMRFFGDHSKNVSKIPVLIPVYSNDQTTISVSSVIRTEAGETKKGKYFNSTFIVSFIMGVILFLVLGGSAVLPWIQTHQTFDRTSINMFEKIFSRSEHVKAMFYELPMKGHITLLLPVSVIIVSAIAVFLPSRRLRGAILLIACLTSAAAWFLIIHTIQNVILLWSPLARYVQAAGVSATSGTFNPIIGIGAWMMAGGLLLMIIIAAVNLHRFSYGALFTLGPFAIIAILGFLYLNNWYRSSTVKVELNITDIKTNRESIKSPGSSSESTIILSAMNRSNKPVVIIPAYYSQRSYKPVSSLIVSVKGDSSLSGDNSGAGRTSIYQHNELPGNWSKSIGEPDLILGLEMEDAESENSLSGTEQVSVTCTFNQKQSAGAVLRPNEKCEISLIFSPVWQNKIWGVTAAGKWLASMFDVNQSRCASIPIEVPGIDHPQDKKLTDVYDYRDNAISQFKAAFDVLQTSSNNESFLPKPVFLAALKNLEDGREKLRNCITCIQELNKLGVKLDSMSLKSSTGQPAKFLDGLSLAALLGVFEDMAKCRMQSARTKLQDITSEDVEIAQLVQSAVKCINRLSLETAHLDYSDKKYEDTVRLLSEIDESVLMEPQLRSETANILLEAVYYYLTETGICLIHSNGSTSSILKPQDGQTVPFSAALTRLAEWKPDLCKGEIFCYSHLVAAQQTKELTSAKVIEFVKSYADSELCQEVYCWLGVEALRKNEYQIAAEYFGKASTARQNNKEDYKSLAGIGAAIAKKTFYQDDCLKQIAVEHNISGYLNARNDWSKEIVNMVPQAVTGNRADTSWIENISIIENLEQLQIWERGNHHAIAFIKMDRNQIDKDLLEKIKEAVETGAILWTSSSFIKEFGLGCQEPPIAFLHSEAKSLPQWQDIIPGNLRFSGGIEYDIRDFKVMLTSNTLGNEPDRYGILFVDIGTTPEPARNRGARSKPPVIKPWFVCAARVIGKGLVVFLPSRITDSRDSRLFLESLVRHKPPNR